MRLGAITWGSAAALALAATASTAAAEVTHVVQPGHTLEAIAHRYHVTVQEILDANHLKEGARLKPGEKLVIPVADDPASAHAGGSHDRHGHGTAALEDEPEPRGHHTRGVIDAFRQEEEMRIRVKDSSGRINGTTLKSFEHLMRQGTNTHPPDPRLVALIGIVTEHFGGRPIEVVSGFRAYTPTQYTPHSNHNLGRALDFRVRGIKNEVLWEYCRTLRNAGCGYYPNSTFVHLDVRDSKAYWIDRSHPGEPPQYDRPGVAADEGASEVLDERPPQGDEPSESTGAAPAGRAVPHGEDSGDAPAVAPASPAQKASPTLQTDPSSERSL